MKNKKNEYWGYLIGLIVFSVLLHIQWFNPWSKLFYGDWTGWSDSAIYNMGRIYQTWLGVDGFGDSNIQLGFVVFKYIWWGLSHLGISTFNAAKLSIFIPLALLSVVSPYVYFYHRTKVAFVTFLVTLFYSTTTYILLRSQGGHNLIAIIYCATPLLFYCVDKALETQKARFYVILSIIFSLMVGYELRISYILALVTIGYVFTHFKVREIFTKLLFIPAILVPLLNVYWILPIIFSNTSASISKVANRGLFGNALFSLQNAATISESAWTGGYPDNFFVPQSIPLYLFILPLIIIGLVYRSSQLRKISKPLIFFTVLAFVGVTLTKQSDEPFAGLYEFLYKRLPTFNLFREASKFYLLVAFGYAGILAYGLKNILPKVGNVIEKRAFGLVSGVIILICFSNILPVLNGSIGGLFVTRPELSDYTKLNSFIQKQPEFFRTLWVPSFSSYGTFDDIHPIVSSPKLVEMFGTDQSREYLTNIKNLVASKQLPYFLRNSAIKYVVVPLTEQDRDKAPFIYYGGEKNPNIRQNFVDLLEKQDYLKPVSEPKFDDLKVYEVKNFTINSRYATFENGYALDTAEVTRLDQDTLTNYFDGNVSLFDKDKVKDVPKVEKAFTKQAILTSPTTDTLVNTVNGDTSLVYAVTPSIKYTLDQEKIEFYIDYNSNLKIDDKKVDLNITKNILYSYKLDSVNQELTLKIDDRYENLILGTHEVFAKDGASFELYKVNTDKDQFEEKFEGDLWSEKVGDCNNYDDNGDLEMSQGFEPSKDNIFLELYATRHTACTQKYLPKLSAGLYRLSLDAKDLTATQSNAKYVVGSTVKDGEYFTKAWQTTSNWKTYNDYFNIQDNTNYNIFVYASEGQTRQGVGYDNIKIQKISSLEKFNIAKPDIEYYSQELKAGSKLEITKASLVNKLVEERFDNGLWSKQLGDCLNYDNNPKISQKIVNESDNNSLELSAERHFACTTKNTTNIPPGQRYIYQFDSKVTGNDTVRSYLSNSENSLAKILDKQQKQGKWVTQLYSGDTSLDDEGSLGVGLYSLESNRENVKTSFDNILFSAYDAELDSVFLLEKPKVVSGKAISTTEEYESATKRNVSISTDSINTMFVTNSETYNPSWQMQIDGKENTSHFVDINGFNVWTVDCKVLDCSKQDGVKTSLSFTPQKYFNIGLGISGTTLFLLIMYLIYSLYTKRGKRGNILQTSDPTALEVPRLESVNVVIPMITKITNKPKNPKMW
jgi:hypothetical protein